MKYLLNFTLFVFFTFSIIFPKNLDLSKNNTLSLGNSLTDRVHTPNYSPSEGLQSREQIDLINIDFEGDVSDWNASEGWELTESSYHTETHSFNSPDGVYIDDDGNPTFRSWDLYSPPVDLPELGDGESMHFDFWLNGDMPGTDCDGDGYLDDYYGISIMDVEALAWHQSDFNSYEGQNYWCGLDDVGVGVPGYLDAWVQYLDTPTFTVPAGGSLSADMYYYLEAWTGAAVGGTCTDGWDQANVQISVDGGNTFMVIDGSDPYDFDCGYGSVYNGFDGLPGWGGNSGANDAESPAEWINVSFDLSSYAGQDAIVRFAFYSDPAYSSIDGYGETGFQVDNVLISGGAFSDDAEGDMLMSVSGAVWVDQFYDYFDTTSGYERPGSFGWEQYIPGLAFNGNVFQDISDFAGKTVIMRFQTRYDELDCNGGPGLGMFIDDVRIYKESSGSYPFPGGLMAESGDESVTLSWEDMNFSGNVDYQFDNDQFDDNNTIYLSSDDAESTAQAGEVFEIAGNSTVNTVSIYNANGPGATTEISAYGTLGTLFNNVPIYTQTVTCADAGWNTFDVDWDMSGSFIISMTFTTLEAQSVFVAPLDLSGTSDNSVVLLGAGWDSWANIVDNSGGSLTNGDWGVRANVDQSGANVTYSVYRDGNPSAIASGLGENTYMDSGLTNNVEYYYQVTATYDDGTESDYSDLVYVTPFAQTVHEEMWDDGSAESSVNAGSGQFLAVKYTACSAGESLVRFKWYQTEEAGAFYLKVFDDDGGMPGDELFSRVVAGGLLQGWNEYDLSGEGLSMSGDFWIGVKEFSSSRPFGLDTDSSTGNSMYTSGGAWSDISGLAGTDGNLMFRALLDGVNCESCTAGDVNADGGIDVLDIVLVVNFIMGSDTPSSDEECASDVNGDGGVDVLDIVNMVNIIVGN